MATKKVKKQETIIDDNSISSKLENDNNQHIDFIINNGVIIESADSISQLNNDLKFIIIKSISTWTKAIAEFKSLKKHLAKNGVVVYIKDENIELNKFINYIKNNRYNAVELEEFYFVQ
jgi:hypothetical protein